MKYVFRIGFIIGIVVLFLGLAIYLPKFDEYFLEKQYVNRSMLVKQDKQEGIHYKLPLADKLSVLSASDLSAFSTEILSIHSITDLEWNDEKLFEELERNLFMLQRKGMIPEEIEGTKLQKSFDGAVYYNVTNTENPNAVVPVWKLTFYEPEQFSCQLIMDADTYDIYSVYICGDCVAGFVLEDGMDTDEEAVERFWKTGTQIGNQIKDYYEADDFGIMNVMWDFLPAGSVIWDEMWDSDWDAWNLCLYGMLYYGENDSGKEDIQIPCNLYYYPAQYNVWNKEGFSISVIDCVEKTNSSVEYK